MAAHSNDKTILGDGLKWNVRSHLFERTVDFFLMGKVDADAYYEIGTLPKGFVPRNVAVVELAKASEASTVALFKTVEGESGSATSVVSASVGGDEPALEVKAFGDADAQLALKAGAAFAGGKVKVAISGDMMTGYWDEALGTSGGFNAADGVSVNVTDRVIE